jgi:hypothetical protein
LDAENGGMCPVLRVGAKRCAWQSSMAALDVADKDGPLVFQHACKLGLEGIVSKHKDSRYHSGRSRHWIKSKNPLSPAVRREAEEDWQQRWPKRARSEPLI